MIDETKTLEIDWTGPYSWPGFEADNHLLSIPRVPGVYIQTFEYQSGYLIYGAGLTRRAIPRRFSEHTRKYLNGEYNVLDVPAAQQGIRKEIWHGWGCAHEHRNEFEARKPHILKAVRNQLANFRIVIADLGVEPRTLERLESAIITNLYQQPSPICDIPDRGMQLSPRRKIRS